MLRGNGQVNVKTMLGMFYRERKVLCSLSSFFLFFSAWGIQYMECFQKWMHNYIECQCTWFRANYTVTGSCEWLLTVILKWQMNNEIAYIIPHQCLFPLSESVYPFMPPCTHLCVNSVHIHSYASANAENSLVSQKAGIREGLQLHGRLCDFLPGLGFDDGPVDVLLQVDEPTVVAHCVAGRDVVVLHKVRVSCPIRTHDVVHVHSNGVADFGRQFSRGGGRGSGLTFPWWVFVFSLKDDT